MIELQRICLKQGAFELMNVSLCVPTGGYGVLMGPTGSGKTTTLEVIAGLRKANSGKVLLHGEDATSLAPAQRNLGFVPQDGALFRTMTVRQNLAFPLHLRKESAARMEQRVGELARWLQIEPLLDRLATGLSGGEAQRIALGRALSFHPKILLLDEPISSVDEATRDLIADLLKQLPATQQTTVLHVTHSRAEAERLADVVFRMDRGRIVSQ